MSRLSLAIAGALTLILSGCTIHSYNEYLEQGKAACFKSGGEYYSKSYRYDLCLYKNPKVK